MYIEKFHLEASTSSVQFFGDGRKCDRAGRAGLFASAQSKVIEKRPLRD